jgi:predicted 3-demethylubiquinone-9 3-methyltransferase (glyoxalase superfamily)
VARERRYALECNPEDFPMSDSVLPFLMFEGQAEEAMRFYVSLFPESKVVEIARYGKGAQGAEGTISRATFCISGQNIMCTDSFVKHAFTFTPAISLFVQCKSIERMKMLVERLAEGGKVYMPLDNYGFSKLFAWVGDRFGVTWQLNLG